VVNKHDNYYHRFDGGRGNASTRPVNSPITAARPQRQDLQGRGGQVAGGSARKAPAVAGSYAGARAAAPKDRPGAARQPKVQGSYAGATGAQRPGSVQMPKADALRPGGAQKMPQAGQVKRPGGTTADRGFDRAGAQPAARQQAPAVHRPAPAAQRPAARPAPSARPDRTAFGGGHGTSNKQARAASERGRQSKQHGGGHGGGSRPAKRR